MNFLNVGPMELLLILLVALIVFGPARLPEIGSKIGRAVGEFRRAQEELTQELTRELRVEARPASAPPAGTMTPAVASSETVVSGRHGVSDEASAIDRGTEVPSDVEGVAREERPTS